MDQPIKVSAKPVINAIGTTDRFVVLYGANTTSPDIRTIASSDLHIQTTTDLAANVASLGYQTHAGLVANVAAIFVALPTHETNDLAIAGDVPVGGIYKTANGELRIVV